MIGTLLLRCDCGGSIGFGHYMRCIALASYIQDCKFFNGIFFISKDLDKSAKELLKKYNFDGIFIPQDISLEDETVFIDQVIREKQSICLVIDNYDVGEKYFRNFNQKILTCVIDDIGDRSYPVKILINQNIGAEKIQYRALSDTKFLMGTKYVMLRPEFLEVQNQLFPTQSPQRAKNILFTFGGSDPENGILQLLEIFSQETRLNTGDVKYVVVIGPSFLVEYIKKLKAISKFFKEPLLFIENEYNLMNIFIEADLIITTASSTLYELAYLDKPVIMFTTEKNQEKVGEFCSQIGFGKVFNKNIKNQQLKIVETLVKLINSKEMRKKIADPGRKLADGFGPKRIFEEIKKELSERKID